MNSSTPIDLEPLLNAIRKSHHEYWRSNEAEKAVLNLWGGPFGEKEIVRIDLPGHYLWYAEIRIAPAPNKTWAISLAYQTSVCGSFDPISPWNRYAYHSRDLAMNAGYDALLKKYHDLIERPHLLSTDQKALARRMIEEIKAHRTQSNQFSLF